MRLRSGSSVSALLLLLPHLGACQQVKPLAADEIRVTGTVKLSAVGVNCWQLVGKDSKSYELRVGQAPEDLLEDGKSVTLVLKPRIDLMSTCQVGQIVDVVRAE
jgi:hypothetical protein